MASLFRPQFTRLDKKTGRRVKKRAKKWYGQWKDAAGHLRRTPLHENRQTAQLMLADLVRGVAAGQGGAQKPPATLEEEIEDWRKGIIAGGAAESYARTEAGRVRKVLTGCGWTRPAQLDAGQAERFLAGLQAGPRGIGPKTRNDYADALRAFGARLTPNPFANLRRVPTGADRRHDRRALTLDELVRLFAAAEASTFVFRGLDGRDRRALYLCAAATGFRASELAALTPAAFALGEVPPVVRLGGRFTKNRQTVVQPIPAGLVQALADYLRGKSPGERVWGGTWAQDAAEMVYHDLRAAGVEPVVQGPDGPLYADFHAVGRHTFISLLDRPGVTIRQAMQLARHGDPRLTFGTYGRAQLAELAGVVDGSLALPLAQASGRARADLNAREPAPPALDATADPPSRVENPPAQDAQAMAQGPRGRGLGRGEKTSNFMRPADAA